MTSKTFKCPKCLSIAQVEQIGHLETLACPTCGFTQSALIVPAEEITLFTESKKVRLVVQWDENKPIADQIAGLRKLLPHLADMPVSDLVQKAKYCEELDIGSYSEIQADELRADAGGYGLTLVKCAE
jgi:hypothetical protein